MEGLIGWLTSEQRSLIRHARRYPAPFSTALSCAPVVYVPAETTHLVEKWNENSRNAAKSIAFALAKQTPLRTSGSFSWRVMCPMVATKCCKQQMFLLWPWLESNSIIYVSDRGIRNHTSRNITWSNQCWEPRKPNHIFIVMWREMMRCKGEEMDNTLSKRLEVA